MWLGIITLFDFSPAIGNAIYTSNEVESVNSKMKQLAPNYRQALR